MKPENNAANENRKAPKKSEEFRNDSAYKNIESHRDAEKPDGASLLAESMVESMEALLAAAEAKNKLITRRVIRPNHRSVTGWLANDVTGDAVPFESTLERDCAYIALVKQTILYFDAHILHLHDSPGSKNINRDARTS